MKFKINFTWILAWLKEKRLLLSLIVIILLVLSQSILTFITDIKREDIFDELSDLYKNNQFLKEKYGKS